MVYAQRMKMQRIITPLCLCIGITTSSCTKMKEKNMNTQEMKNSWLAAIKKIFGSQKSGSFTAKDGSGNPVIFEWLVADIMSPQLAAFKKQVSGVAAQNSSATEVAFLRKHPEAVNQEFLLKPCAPLFAKGIDAVDWKQVADTIKTTIEQFYVTDISSFDAEVIKPLLDDLYVGVTAKDPSGALLGFTLFSITPALAFGEVKLIHISAVPQAQVRDVEKLLLSLIAKLVPPVRHIFTGVRPTDRHALEVLTACGFVPEQAPQDPHHPVNAAYFTVLGYNTEYSAHLQNVATTMVSGVHTQAQEYDKQVLELIKMIYEPGFLSTGGTKEIDEMFQEIDLNGLKALDIGCGLGGPDFYLAKKYAVEIIAIDPQVGIIQQAQDTLRSLSNDLKGTISFVKMENPSNLRQFPDNSFDIVFAIESILNVPSDSKLDFLKDIHRVLKAGGKIIISDLMQAAQNKEHGLPFHLSTPAEFQKALEDAGFAHIHFTETTQHCVIVSQQHIDTIVNKANEIKQRFGQEIYQNALQGTTSLRDTFKDRKLQVGFFRAEKN